MKHPEIVVVSDSLPTMSHPARGIFNSNIVAALSGKTQIQSTIIWNNIDVGWRKLPRQLFTRIEVSGENPSYEILAPRFVSAHGLIANHYFQDRVKRILTKNQKLFCILNSCDSILVLGSLELLMVTSHVLPNLAKKICWIQHIPQTQYSSSEIDALEGVSAIAVPSNFAASLFMASTNYKIRRPKVILNPVNPAFFEMNPEVHDVNRNLIGVATNTPMKDLKLWVGLANELLNRRVIENVTLVTATYRGGNSIFNEGFDLNRINVLFDIPIQAIAEQYIKHSFFLSTSHLETFGLSILEAAYCGCWPLARENGGINEYLDLIPGMHVGDFTKSISDESSILEKFIEHKVQNNNRCLVQDKNRFSYDTYADRLKSVLVGASMSDAP